MRIGILMIFLGLIVLGLSNCKTVGSNYMKDRGDKIKNDTKEQQPNTPHPRDWNLE